MHLLFSPRVQIKLLNKHAVQQHEVEECFRNKTGRTLRDKRAINRTFPSTWWFISQTNEGRRLKIVFIRLVNGDCSIKTAYEPDEAEESIYEIKGSR